MIKSFKCPETEKLYLRIRSTKFPHSIHRAAIRKLWMIDSAQALDDLRVPPGNHLEKLRGDRTGQYSIRVNDQYRICFKWQDGDAYEVEMVDYH